MRRSLPLALLPALLLLGAGPCLAQDVAPAPPAPQAEEAAETPPAREPDLSLEFHATADEVKYSQAGKAEFSVRIDPGVKVEKGLSTGLPKPITVGRSFRDVRWDLVLQGWFTDPAEEPKAPAENSAEPVQPKPRVPGSANAVRRRLSGDGL
jgi:hypothetical protein